MRAVRGPLGHSAPRRRFVGLRSTPRAGAFGRPLRLTPLDGLVMTIRRGVTDPPLLDMLNRRGLSVSVGVSALSSTGSPW